jgi:hypothetical protein
MNLSEGTYQAQTPKRFCIAGLFFSPDNLPTLY